MISDAEREQLRREAIQRLRFSPADLEQMSPEEIKPLVHELEIQQVELEVQNEELRRAQGELAQARDRYLDLYEFAPVGYLTLDAQGTILQANLTLSQLCGIERDKIVGRRLEQLMAREDRDAVYLLLRDAAAAVNPDSRVLQLERPDSRKLWVNITIAQHAASDDQPTLFHVTLSDVSERIQAEVALRLAKDELEQRNAELANRSEQLRRLVSDLTLTEQRERRRLAQVLHDGLQQVLVSSRMRLSALEHARDPEVCERAIQVNELLTESLEISRSLTAELSPPILQQGGLIPALEWLARWMHDKHGLAVSLEAHGKLEPAAEDLTLMLFQATRELLFNVVKHARTNSAHVAITRQSGQIRITVQDGGIGFNAANLGWLGEGGGFGLFSIRERLEVIGGRLEIESTPGCGSTLTIMAPLHEMPADLPEEQPRISVGYAPYTVEHADKAADTIRVMLVDDHLVMRQGLGLLIGEEPDMEIVGEASDGQAAIELARRIHPRVILMDISLPRMNGIEATEIIHAELPDVQIIGLSMFEEQERAAAMRQAGAVGYLTKSGPSEDLIAAIRQFG